MKKHKQISSFRLLATVILFFFFLPDTQANNLQITNSSLTGQDQNQNTAKIKFTVSWENSFRVTIPPSNYDAAWIFIKYRVAIASGGDGIWRHAKLENSGNISATGISLSVQTEGAFVFRSEVGSGTLLAKDIHLLWNYGNHIESGMVDMIDDDDAIEIQLFGIEMVYVPGGVQFSIGGGTGTNAFSLTSIYSANAAASGGYPTGVANNNAAFPNGYNAFYCMKYEISQQQYVDFLNTLSYAQQTTRTAVTPNSVAGTGALSKTNTFRNGIDIKIPGVISGSKPAEYACNLDGDKIYAETTDGLWIACNFLSWGDLTAYLDWSGLRPMTELEFEKACKGDAYTPDDSYAWGSTSLVQILTVKNSGTSNETYGNAGANVSSNHYQTAGVAGPVRVGSFAAGSKSRAQSGASFYGIMELSGNVWERIVSAGTNPVYNGKNGNGALAVNGNMDEITWPAATAKLSGFRGGSWYFYNTGLRISDRFSAQYEFIERDMDNGGRGVRSAP